jgi:hypothetical protein
MPDRNPIIPNHYFSYVSSECQLLFQNGHYFGCIALCQSIAEALARFMYERWTKNRPSRSFKTNIANLRTFHVMPNVGDLLVNLYGNERQRNSFHHLNKDVPTEYEELKRIATLKIDLLNKIESQVFACDFGNGLNVKYSQYWDIVNGKYGVYLRFMP